MQVISVLRYTPPLFVARGSPLICVSDVALSIIEVDKNVLVINYNVLGDLFVCVCVCVCSGSVYNSKLLIIINILCNI